MNYRQNPALGGSDIRAMVADYEKWLFERKLKLAGELPAWLEPKTSPAAEFGTLVHMAILEPWEYAKRVTMPYIESFALKAGKDAKREAQERAASTGGFVVRHEHDWAVSQILERLPKSLPQAEKGTTEIERYAESHGVPVKGKLDWLCEVDGELLLVDVKTIGDFHKREDVLFKSNYHCQLAHYSSLLEYRHPWHCAILWIESSAPFRSELQILDESVMTMAEAARSMAIRRYANGESEGLQW